MTFRQVKFNARTEVWALEKPFRISRGTRTEARLLIVSVSDGEHTGRGEAVPARRYQQTTESAIAELNRIFPELEGRPDRDSIQTLLPPGAARNALDCALWDLEAKRAGRRAWQIAGIPVSDRAMTAFTISLDQPETMAA